MGVITNTSGARAALQDFITDNKFALFDIAPIDSILALPIFTPLVTGFSAVSSPEMTLETMEIAEGNSTFKRQVVKGASVNSLSLSRGVRFYDADFWRWTRAAALGDTGSTDSNDYGGLGNLFKFGEIGGVTYRRTLLLVQFFRNFGLGYGGNKEYVYGGLEVGKTSEDIAAASIVGDAAFATATGVVEGSIAAGVAAAVNFGALTGWALSQGSAESSFQVPARAFVLRGCVPTRYKTGSDFDASSGSISIQELEIAVESFEEISLAA
jgi:hypothetical protein